MIMSKYTIYAIIYVIFSIVILALVATAMIVSAEGTNELLEIEQFSIND